MKKRNQFGNPFKRARYFPPKTPQMCREYCPKCKRICVFENGHFSDNIREHMCASEHKWR